MWIFPKWQQILQFNIKFNWNVYKYTNDITSLDCILNIKIIILWGK